MNLSKYFLLVILILPLLMSACNDDAPEKDAGKLLPEKMDGYRVIESETISSAMQIANVVIVEPQTQLMVFAIDRFIVCARETGTADFRLFVDNEFPEASGVTVAINQDRLESFDFLLDCVFPSNGNAADAPEIRPCMDSWDYTKDDTRYWIMYAATSPQVCADFAQQLPRN